MLHWRRKTMGTRKFVLSVLIGAVKVAVLAGVVYLVCMATLKAS